MVNRENCRQNRDKYLWWPSLFAFLPLVIFALIQAIPDSRFYAIFFVAPFLFFVMAGAALEASIVVIDSFMKKAKRKALSAAILPLVFVLYLLNLSSVLQFSSDLGEIINFYTMYPYYQSKVAELSKTKGQHLAVFTLDGWGPYSTGIAFDDSDEIALPAGKQSADWKARAMGTEISGVSWSASRIQGHFYQWWSDE